MMTPPPMPSSPDSSPPTIPTRTPFQSSWVQPSGAAGFASSPFTGLAAVQMASRIRKPENPQRSWQPGIRPAMTAPAQTPGRNPRISQPTSFQGMGIPR